MSRQWNEHETENVRSSADLEKTATVIDKREKPFGRRKDDQPDAADGRVRWIVDEIIKPVIREEFHEFKTEVTSEVKVMLSSSIINLSTRVGLLENREILKTVVMMLGAIASAVVTTFVMNLGSIRRWWL